ncbi:unnamed protein product [Bemisia tabaci]|uniref:COX assembly mitochondrial protein n=1 Tax=Bemisia tabaci TaxID=7038 RepID=A0A9P0AC92_BEMTA|nr:unnamed protein product [Bemisia tabaci]
MCYLPGSNLRRCPHGNVAADFITFANCAKEHGLFMPFSCQEQGQNLKNCIRKYFEDPEFEKKMQEEYLEERAEYRRTGISKKKRERMEALSQLNAQANQQQSK